MNGNLMHRNVKLTHVCVCVCVCVCGAGLHMSYLHGGAALSRGIAGALGSGTQQADRRSHGRGSLQQHQVSTCCECVLDAAV